MTEMIEKEYRVKVIDQLSKIADELEKLRKIEEKKQIEVSPAI